MTLESHNEAMVVHMPATAKWTATIAVLVTLIEGSFVNRPLMNLRMLVAGALVAAVFIPLPTRLSSRVIKGLSAFGATWCIADLLLQPERSHQPLILIANIVGVLFYLLTMWLARRPEHEGPPTSS